MFHLFATNIDDVHGITFILQHIPTVIDTTHRAMKVILSFKCLMNIV